MDPIIGGALISGATSLLGGLFGRNSERKAIAAQNEYNKPINIRARAEEAGFNPLGFIGPGVGQQTATGGTNYMGAAIADAGLMLGDAIAKKGEATALTALQKENKALADKVQSLTLRPKIGGVYARRQAVPTNRKALGGADAENPASAGGARRGGAAGDTVAVDQFGNPVTSVSLGGYGITANSDYSDAELYETRWGEVGGSLAGFGVMLGDAKKAIKAHSKAAILKNSIEFPKGKRPFAINPTPSEPYKKRYPEKIGPVKWDKNGAVVNPAPWNPYSVNFGAMFQ